MRPPKEHNVTESSNLLSDREFSRRGYKKLISVFLKHNYEISSFHDIQPNKPNLILRHDVDFCTSCAVGLAVIEEIESGNLIEESNRKGKILKDNLNKLKDDSNGRISHVLGEGLISAILFKDPEIGKADGLIASKIAERCYEKGLLVVHTGRESIKLGPPLTITDEALLEGINVIIESFNEVSKEL